MSYMDQNDFRLAENTAPVAIAHVNMSEAELQKIEHDALAYVTTMQDESETKPVNTDASVYGDLLSEFVLPGSKTALGALQVVEDRIQPHGTKSSFHERTGASRVPVTMDVHIEQSVNRPGGIYTSLMGAFEGPAKGEIVDRSNLAGSSLKDQEKHNLGSWLMPNPKTSMPSIQQVKSLTFGQEISSENALASVHAARQEQGVLYHKINQLSPGLGLGQGPTIRPQELLAQAERISEQQAV